MFKYLRRKMPDGLISTEARMLTLAMLFVNLPSLVYGIGFCWLLLPLPGLILYGYCVAMLCNELSARLAKRVSMLTILYHAILFIIVASFFPGFHVNTDDLMVWAYFAAIPFSTICFSFLLLRTLKETNLHHHETI